MSGEVNKVDAVIDVGVLDVGMPVKADVPFIITVLGIIIV